jgi:hypothetical protein
LCLIGLIVAPLMTTVGLKVVERSASLKALVKQISSVVVDLTGTHSVDYESPN